MLKILLSPFPCMTLSLLPLSVIHIPQLIDPFPPVNVVGKMVLVNSNIDKLVQKNDHHKTEIHHLEKVQEVQEAQSTCLEERLKAMGDLMEDQVMRIIGLEEEVAILRLRKVCMCGETTTTTSGC